MCSENQLIRSCLRMINKNPSDWPVHKTCCNPFYATARTIIAVSMQQQKFMDALAGLVAPDDLTVIDIELKHGFNKNKNTLPYLNLYTCVDVDPNEFSVVTKKYTHLSKMDAKMRAELAETNDRFLDNNGKRVTKGNAILRIYYKNHMFSYARMDFDLSVKGNIQEESDSNEGLQRGMSMDDVFYTTDKECPFNGYTRRMIIDMCNSIPDKKETDDN